MGATTTRFSTQPQIEKVMQKMGLCNHQQTFHDFVGHMGTPKLYPPLTYKFPLPTQTKTSGPTNKTRVLKRATATKPGRRTTTCTPTSPNTKTVERRQTKMAGLYFWGREQQTTPEERAQQQLRQRRGAMLNWLQTGSM